MSDAARAAAPTPMTWACIHKIATGDSDLIKVRFAPLCDFKSESWEVREVPHPDIPCYSITSVARSKVGVCTVRPIAFAVLRFITNSNLVGCSIGNSPGSAPLRILST